MSGFLNQAQQKAQEATQETVKQGEQVIQDCVNKGKEVGQDVINQGCQTTQNTCDQVSGQVKSKLPTGWLK